MQLAAPVAADGDQREAVAPGAGVGVPEVPDDLVDERCAQPHQRDDGFALQKAGFEVGVGGGERVAATRG